MRTLCRRIIAVPAVALVALAGPTAALAQAPSASDVGLPVVQLSLDVGPNALLAKSRVVVRVPVGVICNVPGAERAYVSMRVVQAAGGSVASGYGSVPDGLPCDGTLHEAVVSVVADTGGAPFRAGDAAATGSVSACEEAGERCEFLETEPQDLTLRRG